jgi:hypothetical protein
LNKELHEFRKEMKPDNVGRNWWYEYL